MSTAPILARALKYKIKILGTDKSYNFDKAVITIGRGPENDIALIHDSKVSRTHAAIRIDSGRLMVRNVSQKNALFVNGKREEECSLTNGSVLLIGDTQVQVDFENLIASTVASGGNSNLSVAKEVTKPILQAVGSIPVMKPQVRPSAEIRGTTSNPTYSPIAHSNYLPPVAESTSNKNLMYVIGAVLIIGAAILFSGNSGKKRAIEIRSDSEIEKEIQDSAMEVKKLHEIKGLKGQESINFKISDEHYQQGFRDYRQGQYGRAVQSFQAALSFYPQHQLAQKYKQEAERKFEGVVDFNLLQGRQYMDKTNYRLCRAAFTNAMTMIKDSTNIKYREAKMGYDKCTVKMEGGY